MSTQGPHELSYDSIRFRARLRQIDEDIEHLKVWSHDPNTRLDLRILGGPILIASAKFERYIISLRYSVARYNDRIDQKLDESNPDDF